MRKPFRFISGFATIRAELRGRNIQDGVPARRTGVAYRRRTGAAYRRAYGRVREPYKSDGLRCPIIHPKSQNHRKPSETIGNHRKQKYGRNNQAPETLTRTWYECMSQSVSQQCQVSAVSSLSLSLAAGLPYVQYSGIILSSLLYE